MFGWSNACLLSNQEGTEQNQTHANQIKYCLNHYLSPLLLFLTAFSFECQNC
jgi:hypothetical protein